LSQCQLSRHLSDEEALAHLRLAANHAATLDGQYLVADEARLRRELLDKEVSCRDAQPRRPDELPEVLLGPPVFDEVVCDVLAVLHALARPVDHMHPLGVAPEALCHLVC
jgi:hypothetical protein